jgi:hypothetical protein
LIFTRDTPAGLVNKPFSARTKTRKTRDERFKVPPKASRFASAHAGCLSGYRIGERRRLH